MKKYVLLLLLACLQGVVKGQSGVQCTYWIDQDYTSTQTCDGTDSWQKTIDVSSYADGFHSIHFQLTSDEGPSPITSRSFFKLPASASQATHYRCWIDNDYNHAQTGLITSASIIIDTEALDEGFHTVHVMAEGETLSPVQSALYLKLPASTSQATNYRCWIDEDYVNAQTGQITSASILLDTQTLKEGFHTVHVMAEGETLSPVQSALYLKLPASTSQATNYRCWIDEDYVNAQTGQITSASILLDTQTLKEGFHIVHVMVEGETLSPVHSVTYLKMPVVETVETLRCVMSVDNKVCREETVNVSDQNAIWTIDVTDISDGVHFLNLVAYTPSGVVVNAKSSIFVKEPVGGQGITKFDYWLNDNAIVTTREVDGRPKEFKLMTLLPIPSIPIRSSYYHLEMEDGVPVLYAKNDAYIRMYDANGKTAMVTSQFVDYNVKQTVNDAVLLEPNIKQTIAKPSSNTIKWFKVSAEPGDSLEFKLDRAATIQLFSPSGNELYKVSGAESVKWGGCHVKESGVFYLALHDVTAQFGTNISIEYNHIDKYAVLRQNVNLVGNGGCSTITFDGNGFRDLYAVDLFNEQGDSIHHVFIGHESDATTSVVFDFADALIGQYSAVFRFTEEDKFFSNLIKVEEARDIELVTNVIYTSTFIRGTTATYATKVTNKGNQTAYRVPIHYVFKSSVGGISRIKKNDGTLQAFTNNIDQEDLTESEKELLRELLKKILIDPTFFIIEADDENGNPIDESHYVQAFVDIPPNSSVTIPLSLSANNDIECYCVVPERYPTVSTNGIIHSSSSNTYCKDWKDALDCLTGTASLIGDVASDAINAALPGTNAALIANTVSCGLDIIQTANDITGRILCGDNESAEQQGFIAKIWNYMKEADALTSAITTFTKCAEKFIPAESYLTLVNKLADNKKIKTIKRIIGGGAAIESCTQWVSKLRPIKSKAINSYDPNDIYGYTAESGSHAVKDGLTDVYYRIEFENDPEHATGPAHEIVVNDQLDASKFDLSTFTPTRIKIGEKSSELTGEKNFVTTIDMRPEIYAIAQVEGTFDETSGLAQWKISSLDPMTMEPIDDPMIGVLPINTDGLGIGEVSYDIQLREGLSHGTEIPNQATIVFDVNEPITTPVWTNIIDAVAPTSTVSDVEETNETTLRINVNGHDEDSGIWKYELYVQHGENAPWWKEGETDGTYFDFRYYGDIDYGFCVLATDSAGNLEKKELQRERSFMTHVDYVLGDVNGDGYITAQDASLVLQLVAKKITSTTEGIIYNVADVNGDGEVTAQDASLILQHVAKKIDLSNLNQ